MTWLPGHGGRSSVSRRRAPRNATTELPTAAWALLEPGARGTRGGDDGSGQCRGQGRQESPHDPGSDARPRERPNLGHHCLARRFRNHGNRPARRCRRRRRAFHQPCRDSRQQHDQRLEVRQRHRAVTIARGLEACRLLLEYVHQEFTRVGLDSDLVQLIPATARRGTMHRRRAANRSWLQHDREYPASGAVGSGSSVPGSAKRVTMHLVRVPA